MPPRWSQDERASGPIVQGFTGQGFSVDGGVYRSLLLTPLRADGWEPPLLQDLSTEDLQPILSLEPQPEFVVLGTGPSMAFAPRTLVRALDAKGIGIEVMDSRAAARTWGMLRAEERWIVAALLPLS